MGRLPAITEHMLNLVSDELGTDDAAIKALSSVDIINLTSMYDHMLMCDNVYDILTNEKDRVRMFMIIIEVYISTSVIVIESDELMEMCFVDIYEAVYVELGSLLHRHYNLDPGVCDSKLRDLIFDMLKWCTDNKDITYSRNCLKYVIAWDLVANNKFIHIGSITEGGNDNNIQTTG